MRKWLSRGTHCTALVDTLIPPRRCALDRRIQGKTPNRYHALPCEKPLGDILGLLSGLWTASQGLSSPATVTRYCASGPSGLLGLTRAPTLRKTNRTPVWFKHTEETWFPSLAPAVHLVVAKESPKAGLARSAKGLHPACSRLRGCDFSWLLWSAVRAPYAPSPAPTDAARSLRSLSLRINEAGKPSEAACTSVPLRVAPMPTDATTTRLVVPDPPIPNVCRSAISS